MPLKFNQDFLFGVATASTQIEGGENCSNWNHWHALGRVKDNDDPSIANDHYLRVTQDIELLKELNIEVYRFGIEWARIEPAPNQFDFDVLNHYRNELILLNEAGIKPLLTLYHFSHPMWFESMGGFLHPDSLDIFLRFTKKVLFFVEDLVDEYITINEPNVYAMNSYFFNLWPPGKTNLLQAMKVMSTLAEAHIKAYEMIHHLVKRSSVKVSFAHHMRVFEPKDPKNPIHVAATKLNQWVFQDCVTQAMFLGNFKYPLTTKLTIPRGEYVDFIAINYYTRSTISGLKDGVKENAVVNDLGWEIYPEGIGEVARNLYSVLKKDIYITENGVCDNQDAYRIKYLYEHLKVMMESGLPFKRYYHWTFIDNFEWIEGYSAKFGLVAFDLETQIRTIKESGIFYREMIEAHAVSQELYDEKVKPQRFLLP